MLLFLLLCFGGGGKNVFEGGQKSFSGVPSPAPLPYSRKPDKLQGLSRISTTMIGTDMEFTKQSHGPNNRG